MDLDYMTSQFEQIRRDGIMSYINDYLATHHLWLMEMDNDEEKWIDSRRQLTYIIHEYYGLMVL